ncbi:MAG: aminomethyl transferase family protein [Alphaproteobacteria bacterium]|nr:MAG: aminomethyl transferase family protein [Alphaproteobacteria bacterium]
MPAKYDKEHFRKHSLPTPFYPRLAELLQDSSWKSWKGYLSAGYFENVEIEYFAIRNACSVMDLSPMCKYRISGQDAEAFLNRMVTRDMSKLKPGRVGYSVWCNDQGKVIDDGTVFRFDENTYRLCAYERQYEWLMISSAGFDVDISEETEAVAALSVQGPTSFAVLSKMGLSGIETLKPFGIMHFPYHGSELMVSRTGFTADLGYELWVESAKALTLWDELFEAGKHHGIRAIGTGALDIARIEAGFIQAADDFTPANHTIRKDHDRSPLELGLGWLVHLDKPNFTGRRALIREKDKGSRYRFVKLDIDGNKPAHASYIFHGHKKKAGVVTSAVWSPTCKKNIAFASLEVARDHPLDDLWAEVYYQRELQWSRAWQRCRVHDAPFWNPPRRRATPPGLF